MRLPHYRLGLPVRYRRPIWATIAMLLLVSSALVFTHTNNADGLNNTFYIDCSAPTNGDGSLATPWNTPEAFRDYQFAPTNYSIGGGDQILIRRGTTCNWPILLIRGSGVPGNPVYVGPYGTGDRPIINAMALGGAGDDWDGQVMSGAVVARDFDNFTVEGLELTNNGDTGPGGGDPLYARRQGVVVYATEVYGVHENITIRDNYIRDIEGEYDKNTEATGGIHFEQRNPPSGVDPNPLPTWFNNVLIEDNTIERTNRQGISTWSDWRNRPEDGYNPSGPAWTAWTNFIIRNNTISNVRGDGILITNTDGAIIENNIIDGFNELNALTEPEIVAILSDAQTKQFLPSTPSRKHAGIFTYNTDNTLIQYNDVRNGVSNEDGMAFDIDGGSINTTFQYNYSQDNDGGFLLICGELGQIRGGVVRYNVSKNDEYASITTCVGEVLTTEVYNNTVYSSAPITYPFWQVDWDRGGGATQDEDRDINLRNNIFAYEGQSLPHFFYRYHEETLPSQTYADEVNAMTVADNNLYYNVVPPSKDARAISGDPQFVDTSLTAGGFEFFTASPGFEAGVTVPSNGGIDYFGTSLAAPFNIGAIETATNTPPSDIQLSNTALNENVGPNTTVGTFTTTDVDADSFTYSIVSGAGDTDNASFSIGGLGNDELILVPDPDFEAQPSYSVRVNVNDGTVGNDRAEQFNITINDLDEVAPVISLAGSSTVNIAHNGSYNDAGATALDDVDGDITGSIVVNNPVNTAVVGMYTVTYDVSDAAGNAATQVTRTVNVNDASSPVITLLGSSPVTVNAGDTYNDAGATALDDVDGDITGSIVVNNPVNIGVPGSYTVTYDVSDSASNPAIQVSRVVNVIDATPPTITLLGTTPVNISAGATYVDAGATALDAIDGDVTSSVVVNNPVNTAIPSTYTITYDVQDAAGNAATQITRTVVVSDTTPPTITYSGSNPITLQTDSTYTPPTVTASDAVDGDITVDLIVGGDTVDTATAGSYTVTYDVQDAAGNAATQLTITINVVDPPPVDTDGIDDVIEDAAPNSGDGNNDGLQDSQQSNVVSIVNSVTSQYITIQALDTAASKGAVPSDCQVFTSATTLSENTDTVDENYDYPIGLVDFTLSCNNNGDSSDITIYLDQQYDTSDWVLRKYSGSTYDTIDAASFGTDTVGGTTVTTIQYTVSDGGALDNDAAANGTIIDPVGPAVLATTDTQDSEAQDTETLQDTGTNSTSIIATGLFITVLVCLAYYRKRPGYSVNN